jgi:ketosteroid isomerase-like protein
VVVAHTIAGILIGAAALAGAVIPYRSAQPSSSAPSDIPPSLAAMAATERAFSARASEVGWRDAFIEFFADESVSFQPDSGPARERLRKQPAPKPGTPAFTWEPRFGDVAASGDLGYLTGPVKFPQANGGVGHGCYFSVWKKQADGTFRVILDVGARPPSEAPFAPGLVRSPARAARTARGKAEAERTLLEADRALGQAIGQHGPGPAFKAVLHDGARVHRNGVLPMTTRDAAVAWFTSNVKAMTSETMKSETGASGDLGYTWGKVQVTSADGKVQAGYYVRVWTVKADGGWQLVADVIPG